MKIKEVKEKVVVEKGGNRASGKANKDKGGKGESGSGGRRERSKWKSE